MANFEEHIYVSALYKYRRRTNIVWWLSHIILIIQVSRFSLARHLLQLPAAARAVTSSTSNPGDADDAIAPISIGSASSATSRPSWSDSLPRRPFPVDTIVLANGATTFVSSLDEFLSGALETTEATVNTNGGPNARRHLEREDFLITSTRKPRGEKKLSNLAIVFGPSEGEESAKNRSHSEKHQHNQRAESDSSRQQHAATGPSESGGKHHHEVAAKNSSTKPIPQHWQVKSLLNVTQDYPLAYSQIICGYVWPLMAAITLFTNLMIVFVLTQRDMRTPTNVVLTAIAIADIIPIVVPVPWFVYLFAMGNEKQVLYPPVTCYFYQHSTRSVSEIFYFLSTWLNVLLAVQDYLTACRPELAKKYCQIKVVVTEIVLLTLFAFLLNLPQALKLVFKPVKFYYNNQLTWGCKAFQAKWFKDFVGEHVALYDDIFTAIIVLFVDGGPAVVLITLTALLIRQLQRQRIKGHLLMEQARTASKRRRERHRQQEYESSARVMIFVLLAFLAVKIPFATTYTLMIIQSRFEIHFVENLVDFQKAITLTDLVFVLSYPINFTIFCCCSKKFRHKCAQLLSECSNRSDERLSKGKKFMSSISSSINEGSFLSSLRGLSNMSVRSRVSDSVESSLTKQQLEHLRQLQATAVREQNLRSIEEEKRDQMMLLSNDDTALLLDMSSNGFSERTKARDTRTAFGSEQQQAQEHSQAECDQECNSGRRHSSGSYIETPQLEDGRLCVECILRYEQIRGSLANSVASSFSPPSSRAAGSGGHASRAGRQSQLHSWSAGMPIVQPAFFHRHDLPHHRRASQTSDTSNGTGWPLHQAAPSLKTLASLSAIQQQQQQQQQGGPLPQIITTTCESIREQTSQEESSSTSGNRQQQPHQLGAHDRDATENCSWAMSKNSSLISTMDPGDDGGGFIGAGRELHVGQDIEVDTNKSRAMSLDGRRGSSVARASQMAESSICSHPFHWSHSGAYLQNALSSNASSKSDLSAKMTPQNEPMRHGSAKPGKDRGSKMKAASEENKEQMTRAQLCRQQHLQQKRSSEGSTRSINRQRSLSLSNSNLTTLPNATGLLADVLVGALLSTSGQSMSTSKKSSGGKKDSEKKKKGKGKK